MTPTLQPRPQFVAQAVLSDALADAQLEGDRCQGDISLYAWKRGDGRMLTAWANAGERDLTLEVPAGQLTLMDLMGNRRSVSAVGGVATVHLTTKPVYIFGGGDISVSHRLESRLEHGSTRVGQPKVRLLIRNNQPTESTGEILWQGPIQQPNPVHFSLPSGEEKSFFVTVASDLPPGKRVPIHAEVRCDDGTVFGASASLNFAQALSIDHPPALDGTWNDWETAPAIEFGKGEEVATGNEVYRGPSDISGRIRLIWDRTNLYLGVEALDDKFVAVPTRGRNGYTGDSIEFGVQPNNLLAPSAPFFEFELYLPDDGRNRYCASRRVPAPDHPDDLITHWLATIKPTGMAGNVNYQVAIPWSDLGMEEVTAGRTISLALVLNDVDEPNHFSGYRKRIRWFQGVDNGKNPEGYGDVTLVDHN